MSSSAEKTIPLTEIKPVRFDNNLLNAPILGALLRNKYFLPVLQVILGAIFIYAIVYESSTGISETILPGDPVKFMVSYTYKF